LTNILFLDLKKLNQFLSDIYLRDNIFNRGWRKKIKKIIKNTKNKKNENKKYPPNILL
jgi:hypothetical protein